MSKASLIALTLALGTLALAGCQTTKVAGEAPPPVADPCPAEGLAPVQAEPIRPVIPESAYAALGQVTGGQAIVRYWDAELGAWGRLGWNRVTKMQEWCTARQKPPAR